MAISPDFKTGLNDFTPQLLNRIVDAMTWLEERRQDLESLLHERRRIRPLTWVPAFITGYQEFGSQANRWEYAWVEAIWNKTDKVYEVLPAGLNSGNADGTSFTTPAYNRVEAANDGLLIESGGIHVEGPAFPATFFLQPIQGDWNPPADETWDPEPTTSRTWDLDKAPCVQLWLERNDAGGISYMFDGWNVPDGECPA